MTSPRRPRKPSSRHSDFREYIPTLRTLRGLPEAMEAAAIPFEPVGVAANDNFTEGRASRGRLFRPDDKELENALAMPGEDNLRERPQPKHRQVRGFRFTKQGRLAREYIEGQGFREYRVAEGELVAFQLANGGWMRAREEIGEPLSGQHAAPASPSTSHLAQLFGGKYTGDSVTLKRQRTPRSPGMDRPLRAAQLCDLGVDGSVDLATARANCGLPPVAANDNRKAVLGWCGDPAELFMSCQVAFKGNFGWRTSRGALDMMVLAEELRDLVASIPSDLLMRTDLILRASCLAEIGEAYGKAGRTAESAGKRITVQALSEIKSILSNQGLMAIAA